jgi:hypothetical protein
MAKDLYECAFKRENDHLHFKISSVSFYLVYFEG